jgi:hypothetical protein
VLKVYVPYIYFKLDHIQTYGLPLIQHLQQDEEGDNEDVDLVDLADEFQDFHYKPQKTYLPTFDQKGLMMISCI